ncbi:GNAT family N-acetyltransferase [uncultured Litoreibacter sp.]|uniref:GNAT family N-acetyltransferase n=1 Tax=uncultured Litoreibacter sp. TaxID=1392394 RepID=UPI002630024A|nr:GNAT family N-acetyltransferase [uncultured Litoreibacter sp.]
MTLRRATEDDFAPLTVLWAEGWDAGHLKHAPKALAKLRTAASFHMRLRNFGDDLMVTGERGAPTGFVAFKGDHIDQFYVRLDQRGTGLAAQLMQAAEAELMNRGYQVGVLDCATKNERARAFYEKAGWVERGIEEITVDTSAGPFTLRAHVYEKPLRNTD